MSAPFIIPFNNNPASTSIKTASYTIPAGKYAKIYGANIYISEALGANPATQTRLSPSFQIDGQVISSNLHITITATSSTTGTRTITYPSVENISDNIYVSSSTNNTNNILSFSLLRYSRDTILVTANGTTTTATDLTPSFTSSMIFQISTSVTNATTYTAKASIKNNESKDFWIPSGTVISIPLGTAKYIIEEYNQIS
jgi:hypothetical protein